MALYQLREALISFEDMFNKVIIRNNDELFVMAFESCNQARSYLIEQGKEAYLNQNVTKVKMLVDTIELSI